MLINEKGQIAPLYLDHARNKLSINLDGLQWHTLLLKLHGQPLTELGENCLASAIKDIRKQLVQQVA